MLPMLENKDGTRTIEMILKSTVLTKLLQIGIFKYKLLAYRMWDVPKTTIASFNTDTVSLPRTPNLQKYIIHI